MLTKNLFANILAFTILLIGFTSCSEEQLDPVTSPLPTLADRTEKSAFIDHLLIRIKDASAPKTGTIQPENLNNYMDDFGVYFRNMLVEINQLESVSPSTDPVGYQLRYTTHLNENPFPYDFMDLVVDDFEFYGQLAEIIRTIQSDDPNLTISQLKTCEDIIAQTSLLTDLEREALLAFSAKRKYLVDAIRSEGVIAMGEVIPPSQAFTPCFDEEFNKSMKECVEVFTDYTAPFSMILAWTSMPATMGACIGDAIISGIINC